MMQLNDVGAGVLLQLFVCTAFEVYILNYMALLMCAVHTLFALCFVAIKGLASCSLCVHLPFVLTDWHSLIVFAIKPSPVTTSFDAHRWLLLHRQLLHRQCDNCNNALQRA